MPFFTHMHSDMFCQVGEKGVESYQTSQEFIHSTNIYCMSILLGLGNTLGQGRQVPCPDELLDTLVTAP
jgi:hypothetical protein